MTKVTSLAFALLALVACSDDFRSERVTDLAVTAERVLSPFDATPETEALLKTAREAAWHLDVARLHDALPPTEDPARFVVFEGRQVDGRRVVSHELPRPERDVLERPDVPLRPIGDEPGDGWLFAGVAPLPDPSSDYRLRVTTAVVTGAGDGFVLWRELPPGLRLLERELETCPAGQDLDISSVDDLRRRFPATTEFVFRYVEARVRSKSTDPRRSEMQVSIRTRFEALGEDYPELAAYASRLARSFRSGGVLETDRGAALASWSVRGEEGLRIDLSARDGRLAPKTGSEPLVDLLAPQRLRFVSWSSMELYGVKNTIEGVRGTVRTEPNGAAVFVDINGEPARVAIEGAFVGIVPVGAVDLVIPGDLETVFRSILSTFLRGRGGRGVALMTESRAGGAHEKHWLSSTLLSDVPSGSFARIGLRLAADRIRADEHERADLVRFGRDLIGRFRTDLRR